MSVNLNPTLATAQLNSVRAPMIKIFSTPLTQDIPFLGNLLAIGDNNDSYSDPSSFIDSTGVIRLICVDSIANLEVTDNQGTWGGPYGVIIYYFSDTERSYFNTPVRLASTLAFGYDLGGYRTIIEAATMCQLPGGNFGIIYIAQGYNGRMPSGEQWTDYYLCSMVISPAGVIISDSIIKSFNRSLYELLSPTVVATPGGGFMLAFILDVESVPVISGTYTGTTTDTYYLEIVQDGDNETALFQFRKGLAPWSPSLPCSTAPQLMAEGLSVAWPTGNFWAGQNCSFSVLAPIAAFGTITVVSQPLDGDTVTIGDTVYTFKNVLGVAVSISGEEVTFTMTNPSPGLYIYTGMLAQTPVMPGSVSFLVNGMTVTDDGNSYLSNGGSIDYETGLIRFNYAGSSPPGKIIAISYKYNSAPEGVPNQVLIDPLGYQITLIDLCNAIMATSYEGSGPGVRYGVGTEANEQVVAGISGSEFVLNLAAIVVGPLGDDIPIITDGSRLVTNGLKFGAYSSYGPISGLTNASRIFSKTSPDFSTWGEDTLVSPAGIVALAVKLNCFLSIIDEDIWLSFDIQSGGTTAAPIYNCYYTVTTDGGVTWADAIALTDYASVQQYARHPSIIAYGGDLLAIVDEENSSLIMDRTTPGYAVEEAYGISQMFVTNIQYSPGEGSVYVICSYTYVGNNPLMTVFKINLETWTITNVWEAVDAFQQGRPSFNAIFFNQSVYPWRWQGSDNYVLLGVDNGSGAAVVSLLDGEGDTITTFVFGSWSQYGLTRNVNTGTEGSPGATPWEWGKQPGGRVPTPNYYQLQAGAVDYSNNLIYLFWTWTGSGAGTNLLCTTLSLTNQEAPFTLNQLWNAGNPGNPSINQAQMIGGFQNIKAFLDANICVIFGVSTGIGAGFMVVLTLDQGGVLLSYVAGSNNFPLNGVTDVLYSDGVLYFTFPYNSAAPAQWGLGMINLSTGAVTYAPQPATWISLPMNFNKGLSVTDDGLIICPSDSGIFLFNPTDNSWQMINNQTNPGLTPDGSDVGDWITEYDAADGLIFFGHGAFNYPGSSWMGLVVVSRYGEIQRSFYSIAVPAGGGGWNFGDFLPLVQGTEDYQTVGAIDPSDGTIWAFWTRGPAPLSLVWDKQTPVYDLTPLLDRKTEVNLTRSIDTAPATLSFAVANGYLFDDYNSLSLLTKYLQKGRQINLSYGEIIDGGEFWQVYGWYLVRKRKVVYQRGTPPIMQVQCEDIRTYWGEQLVWATPLYQGDAPDIVLKDLITNYSNMPNDMLETLQPFNTTRTVNGQWIDSYVSDIIDQLVRHFGYMIDIDVTGQFRCRPISDQNSIDNVYAGITWLQQFTPDDDYTNWINKVTVSGETLTYVMVTFTEERVYTLTGTIGWWAGVKRFICHYSQDDSATFIDPNLVVIDIGMSFVTEMFGGLSQSIVFVDPANHYCIVEVEAPDLVGLLIAMIAVFVVSIFIPDGVIIFEEGFLFFGVGEGITIPIGSAIRATTAIMISQILGSISNFNYEIMASPVGYVHQSFSDSAEDDVEMAKNGNIVVEQIITDVLCTLIQEATLVCQWWLLFYQMQRYRCSFTKLANLQDEPGDTIQIPHPFSGSMMTIYINKITRRYKPPEVGQFTDGYFWDDIDGWIIAGTGGLQ